MEPRKDASAPEPRDRRLLPDDMPCIEGKWPDGTPYKIIKPADPAPRPAPLQPKSIDELRERIMERQSRLLECDPGALAVWPDSIADLLNAARALGLAPPPMPFPGEFHDAQHGLANIDALLRWLADSSTYPPSNHGTRDDPSQSGGNTKRRGRLPKAEGDAKRVDMLAKLRQHPTLKEDVGKLAGMVGVSEPTARRWLDEEEQRYRESRAGLHADSDEE